jgi:hypothetical protein
MNWVERKYIIYLFLTFATVVLGSCKTDEFKFGEIKIKEDWGIEVISPLFVGNGMEFRDFIYDWKKKVPNSPAPFTVLEYSNNSYKTIPTGLIFSPSVVIDSFPFYIQGAYSLTEVELVFKVSNGCPFPLNLQMQFFDKSQPNILGPIISPLPFDAANFEASPEIPETTTHSVKLDSLQLHSFNNSDRIKFNSWYGRNAFIDNNDTISAHYPVDLLITLIGVVQGKNED